MNKRENTEKMASLGRMTRGMIHDLNNSLASILGYSEFLVADLEEGSEPQEFAKNIHRATQQIQDMIDQIRAFSLEKGEGRDQALNLVDEIKDIARRYEDMTDRQATIDVRSNVGEATASLPSHQFRTLIGNIIRNAIEAGTGAQKNVTISIEDAHSPVKEPNPAYALTNCCLQATPLLPHALRIIITDNGIGMDEIILGLATEAYFSTKSSESAHGVGLTIVKGILEHIGGGLSIASTPGKGTSVTIIFPAETVRKEEPSHTKTEKKARILLVEDRNLVRDTVEKMLTRQGHTVTACASGLDALDHLREHMDSFNLIITDYTMPELDGPNFVTELRNDFPDIPVIIMSGDQQYLRDLNADLGTLKIKILEKPIEGQRLCNLINNALNA